MHEPTPEAAIGISLSVALDDKRSIVFQTHVPQSATLFSMHKLTDMLSAVADRQEAKVRREKLAGELETHHITLERFVKNLADVDAKMRNDWIARGRKGDAKLSATEQVNRDNLLVSVDRYKQEITKITKEIAECDALISLVEGEQPHGASSATDSDAGLPDR